MKKILSLLMLLVAIVTGAWADTDPTLAIGATAQTTSTFLGEYKDEGITISSSASWSSGAVQLGNTPSGTSAYNAHYLQIAAGAEIEKVSFLISGNGDNKSIQAPLFGWAETPSSNTADTYRLLDAQTVTKNAYSSALWFNYDLSASNVKYVRIYRSTKDISSTEPEYTGSSTALGSGQTIKIYGIKVWLKASAATVAPSTPTFTVDGGAVTGGTTTTIASENASKIYYAWTESATAPEKGDAAYSELSGASKAVTIPNVSGTKYLHAYGWNNYNTSSTSDIKSAEFTITKDVTAPKTWNFATDFSDETKTALETNFTYDEGNARYKSSAKITANTDLDLGTYAAPVFSGLIMGNTADLSAGNLRIKENGYVQINGGKGYYKIKNLKDGDVVNIRFTSANQTSDRTFTVTGATETTATAYAFYKGYSEATITKSGNGDLKLAQDNGINVWTISVNEELPALATTTEGITVGTEGVATYVTNNAIDFTGVTDLTAYIATSNNNDYVFTEAVTGIVPGGTALLIKGASASIPMVQATSTSVATLEGNILKASDGKIEGDESTIYAFSKTNKKFQKVATGVKIPSGKAYLVIESGEAPTALDVQFDGEATAVEAIAEAQAEAVAPVKVIKNGKLFIGNYNVAGQLVK